MTKFFIVLVACLALARAGVQRRDAPSALDEVQKHAAEFQKTITEQFNSLANSKNTQDFNKALKEGSDTVLQQLSALSSSLQGALTDANGKAKEALETTRSNLEKQVEELRKSHPDVEKQASALKDKLQAAVTNAVQETQKLAKEVSTNVEQTNQKLAPTIKQAYDDLVKQVEAVQKKLHEAASKQ
ncbi:apolipophorin-3 [Amyelois transitella]|uniref:apolipophorin-3 n=1 Tax=Amyelois transitella TaxID=680683 RepID=UPI00298FDDDA|nr:apolipophorin-3 [Amyelois transitella]XP_013197317.2 apolipophorin-3 [Amyelois transitella]